MSRSLKPYHSPHPRIGYEAQGPETGNAPQCRKAEAKNGLTRNIRFFGENEEFRCRLRFSFRFDL